MGEVKSIFKGFLFLGFGILIYVVIPIGLISLAQSILMFLGTFYPFNPVPVVLLGIPAAGTLFLLGFFKGESVGHGIAGMLRSLVTAAWVASAFPGVFYVYLPLQLMEIVNVIVFTVLDVKGLIMLTAYVIAATALIYLVEVYIGVRNKQYWVYS
ncbi:MAG: hypothetical protein ACTSWP_05990 [Candidatus Freyarchaeota archaeon]|nr:hypothetical protein [Candidatus Freyrarchaeum guaymaensis]